MTVEHFKCSDYLRSRIWWPPCVVNTSKIAKVNQNWASLDRSEDVHRRWWDRQAGRVKGTDSVRRRDWWPSMYLVSIMFIFVVEQVRFHLLKQDVARATDSEASATLIEGLFRKYKMGQGCCPYGDRLLSLPLKGGRGVGIWSSLDWQQQYPDNPWIDGSIPCK